MAQMNIYDLLVRKTAVQVGVDERDVECIIYNGQWRATHEAIPLYKNIEIKGLGTFILRKRQLERQIRETEGHIKARKKRIDLNENPVYNNILLKNTEKYLQLLKTKLQEYENSN